MLTVGSLFSGVGGFDLGFARAGFDVRWQCESDKKCRNVLARNFPDVEVIYSNVETIDRHLLSPVDVICGGFPCQDISVAGRRAGLAGDRSGLWWQFRRIVSELAPEWVVIENVPGLLSSGKRRDMGAVLGALGELGYGWAYRVFDAQYDGLAQRRERVFIVGHLGDGRASEVLFEPDSVPGDHPPCRREREDVAGTLGGGSGERGWASDTERMTFVAAPLVDAGKRQWSLDALNLIAAPVAATLSAGGHPNSNEPGRRHEDDTNLVSVVGFNHQQDPISSEGISVCLGDESAAIAYQCHGTNVGEMGTLRRGNGSVTGGVPFVIQDAAMPRAKKQNGIGITEGGPMYTLDGHGAHGIANLFGVRRLMPVECERLQGFPDHWTRYEASGKEIKDGPRYRMLGNAVAVPVAEWIARRILAVTA